MSDNLKGILAVLSGSTAFVLADAIVKLVSVELPAGEIITIRGMMATAFLTAGVLLLGAARPLSVLCTSIMMLRLVSAAAATTFIVISLRDVPLAIVNTVLQVTPLAVTAGAAVVYGEKVGARRWVAAAIGFLGVVLIVQPGTGALGLGAYVVLVALVFTTTRDLATRGLDRDIPSIFIAAASSAAIVPAGLVLAPFESQPWVLPSAGAWAMLTASATLFFVANTLIIFSLRTGEIAVVAPFRYAGAPFAVLLGWWWWGDIPDALAFLGIGLVMAAGLYTLHRERRGTRPIPALERSAAE